MKQQSPRSPAAAHTALADLRRFVGGQAEIRYKYLTLLGEIESLAEDAGGNLVITFKWCRRIFGKCFLPVNIRQWPSEGRVVTSVVSLPSCGGGDSWEPLMIRGFAVRGDMATYERIVRAVLYSPRHPSMRPVSSLPALGVADLLEQHGECSLQLLPVDSTSLGVFQVTVPQPRKPELTRRLFRPVVDRIELPGGSMGIRKIHLHRVRCAPVHPEMISSLMYHIEGSVWFSRGSHALAKRHVLRGSGSTLGEAVRTALGALRGEHACKRSAPTLY